jgi:hypothetical protein
VHEKEGGIALVAGIYGGQVDVSDRMPVSAARHQKSDQPAVDMDDAQELGVEVVTAEMLLAEHVQRHLVVVGRRRKACGIDGMHRDGVAVDVELAAPHPRQQLGADPWRSKPGATATSVPRLRTTA